MRKGLDRLSMVLSVTLLTAAGVLFVEQHAARGQHNPPTYPKTEKHVNTPCFGGNICYVCPQDADIACTDDQPAAGWTQGPCHLGYPASGKTCEDTDFDCGAEVKCSGGTTGQNCYNGDWCKV